MVVMMSFNGGMSKVEVVEAIEYQRIVLSSKSSSSGRTIYINQSYPV